jgi:hypothetical protein
MKNECSLGIRTGFSLIALVSTQWQDKRRLSKVEAMQLAKELLDASWSKI